MKIASRYLLPLELLLAILLISWGVSGWLGRGTLWQSLFIVQENKNWGVFMVTIGTFQLASSVTELAIGRRWCNRLLLTNVSLRCVGAFLASSIWIYVCYLLIVAPATGLVVSLCIQAPCCLVLNCLVYAGNLKVRYVLNPDVPTSQLEQTIVLARDKYIHGGGV